MSFASIKSDPLRIKKDLEISTKTGRYQLDVPGPGNVGFYEDPFIRLQKFGANLMTNTINLESDIKGLNKKLKRDCDLIKKTQNDKYQSRFVRYNNVVPLTEQTRTTHPVSSTGVLPSIEPKMLHFNPQENVFLPFNGYLSTRILEKDTYNSNC